ncbi:MAG: 30S ribosomal protein S6 [Patescibacteria group bacterium]
MDIEKDNKKYEIGFLAKEEGFKEKLIKLVEDFGGEVIDNGGMSRIKLAYPIKKETSAFFGYFYFSCQAEMIKKISENLKLNSEILRHIIISTPVIQQAIQSAPKRPPRRVFSSEIPAAIAMPRKPKPQPVLSNEALEKKLEEILK